MECKKTSILVVLLMLLFCNDVVAQSLVNVRAETQGEKVIVTYDLNLSEENQKFDIELFSSINGYGSPLKLVSGDVGKGILPGRRKQIVWSAADELDQFQGDVTFEVRAVVISPPIEFVNPREGTSFKKGKIYQIKWTGLNNSSGADLLLYRNGVKHTTLSSSPGSGDYTWQIPTSSKPGSGYQIKLETGNNQKSATSGTFRIKRKIPLALKIAPILVIGGVVAAISGGGDSGSSGPGGGPGPPDPPVNESLPAPPPPPGN